MKQVRRLVALALALAPVPAIAQIDQSLWDAYYACQRHVIWNGVMPSYESGYESCPAIAQQMSQTPVFPSTPISTDDDQSTIDAATATLKSAGVLK